MKLRYVMLLVVGPLFAYAGYLKFQDIAEQRAVLVRAHDTTVITHEGALVDDVVHELQRERGFSAGYIASKGASFAPELDTQRDISAKVIEALQSEVDLLTAQSADLMADVSARFAQLEGMRKRVDSFSLTVPEMAKFYTDTIEVLLDLARPPTSNDQEGRLQSVLNARALVGAAKEAAGLERAMGATGLSAGFALAMHNRYVELGGAQGSLLHETAGFLHDYEWWYEVLASSEYKALQDARGRIIASFGSDQDIGLTAAQWFKISSDWIDFLRAKELEFVVEFEALTEEMEAEASARLSSLIWIGVFATVSVLAFAVVSFERVIGRIKYLISVINDFAAGNYDVEISGTSGRDELSGMARAFDQFKQDTLEMKAAADTLKEKQERLKAQQDQVVNEISAGLDCLAHGDLTHKFSQAFPEEYETLRDDFTGAMAKLNKTLSSVVHNTASIREAATQINDASLELSRRSESQAATLEETSAALEDLTSSVQAAADGAKGVQNTTSSARNEATQSGGVVREAVSAMSEISDSSSLIAQNISVIDDIAFQTNLLALNAGVEAARAGEAGSGFAVVASEVRALALKSSEAATEIKSLIGQSVDHVSNGVELVNRTGTALESIVGRVGHISDLVAEMATGSRDQATGLGELNASVSQLDQVTQQNATMAQQASTTCQTLKVEADELEVLVGQFKLFEIGEAQAEVSDDESEETSGYRVAMSA